MGPGCYFCSRVFTAKTNLKVASNLVPTLAAKHLYGAGDTIQADALWNEGMTNELMYNSATDSQAGVRQETGKNLLKVIRSKGYIGIQVANKVVNDGL
jgi:hypothetical protein